MREWVIRHHLALGAVGAALVGLSAWNLYRAGVAIGEVRGRAGESARIASQALGG